jgi:dolichyl-phosphate-mannose--protein O-mannosyl transferase
MKLSVFSTILFALLYPKVSLSTFSTVTCGSAIKLRLVEGNVSPYLLHSAAFNWGSGSGQQVVSLIKKADSSERTTLWQLQEGFESAYCKNGQPIHCGDTVRLMHLKTKKYLHSHFIPSVLSPDSYEISAFGGINDTGGDSGDNWILSCNGTHWMKGDDIKLRHLQTGAYLGRSVLLYFYDKVK